MKTVANRSFLADKLQKSPYKLLFAFEELSVEGHSQLLFSTAVSIDSVPVGRFVYNHFHSYVYRIHILHTTH